MGSKIKIFEGNPNNIFPSLFSWHYWVSNFGKSIVYSREEREHVANGNLENIFPCSFIYFE
jgi:hypothetical protein